MLSLTRGRALFALVLSLAAVLAVTPVLTAAADPGAAAAGKSKKSCKKGKGKGKAKGSAAKGCKKAKGKAKAKPKAKKPSATAPKPGARLTGTNVLVGVGLQYPGEIPVASVTINNIPATCSDGTTKPVVGSALAPIKGMSFSGSKDFSGGYSVTISGTFSSATKVSGTLSMTPLTFPNGTTCTVAPVQFSASA